MPATTTTWSTKMAAPTGTTTKMPTTMLRKSMGDRKISPRQQHG
ncbi:hypothetical protein [Acetobacter lambici]|nr:hypothetical protein [Acetobacter lambici]